MSDSRGLLLVVSGPSGVGKGTVLAEAFAHLAADPARRIRRSVSVTTRRPAPTEKDGVEYHFVSDAEFDNLIQRDALLEWACIHGRRYGTPREWIAGQLAAGTDVVLEIDVQGALQVRERQPEAVLIFIEPPSSDTMGPLEVLGSRLRSRRRESEEEIRVRLQTAERELTMAAQYDYRLVNDDLETCVHELTDLIRNLRRAGTAVR